MSTTSFVTADQLLSLPMGMGKRYELVLGELRVMSPGGWRHGNVVSNLHVLLAEFIRKNDLGMMFGAETGFRLARNPDTVRAPDIAFISKQHLPTEMPREAFWPGAPDLAVEVLSPDDRRAEVDEKTEAWLDSGAAAVWIVDPKLKTVAVYRTSENPQTYPCGASFSGDPVVPGFSCRVDDVFQ